MATGIQLMHICIVKLHIFSMMLICLPFYAQYTVIVQGSLSAVPLTDFQDCCKTVMEVPDGRETKVCENRLNTVPHPRHWRQWLSPAAEQKNCAHSSYPGRR